MDQANDPPVPHQVDVMDVSPAVHTEENPLDDKENDADLDAPSAVTPVKPDTPVAGPMPEEDPRDTAFTYVLRKYSAIDDQKVYSPWHHFGGFKWRLLIFPKGNQSSNHDLSVYLECGGPSLRPQDPVDPVSPHPSPNGKEAAITTMSTSQWSRPAKFSLHVVHPLNPIGKAALAGQPYEPEQILSDLDMVDSNVASNQMSRSEICKDIMKETSHNFRETASDWGFLEFAPFAQLQPTMFADDGMNVVLMVRIHLQDSFPDHMFANTPMRDSRKETGYVGFKNQGATCYMNSLLQTLYMLSAFRKAVYNMPLPEPGMDNSGSELSYALQKVFYELQFSPTVVKTKKLTESFGWDTTDAFTQHDVQELKLILCDELAEKMKKIAPDKPNTLATLFQGKILNYIECVHVDYKSTREEEFSDLSLNVKGCRNVYDSFEKYTEVEMMEGENKYRAEGYEELQEAKKGVKFLSFPPVLQLHLKRFEFDLTRYTMVKINDRYEFETEIDLSRFVEKSNGDDIYVLHSVLVHIGDVNGGHYHAFIRPKIDVSGEKPAKPSEWYKYDDEIVTLASEEAAVQDNFGVGGEREQPKRGGLDDDLNGVNGGQTPPSVFQTRNRNYQTRRFSNAYMLQYLRKSSVPTLLQQQKDEDVPKELAIQINKEIEVEEQRKRERTEHHLYMNIAVATNEDMVHHHGADLVNWDKVRQLRVKRALQLGELKMRLQNEGLVQDARRMRLWKCSGRQNDTTRPDSLVALGRDSQPITDPNGRDPLTQSGYNVPLYSGRHGYYGQDDAVKMYAEDLLSSYCLAPGQAFTSYVKYTAENGETIDAIDEPMADGKVTSDMETDVTQTGSPMPSFALAYGKEVLLFLKYYSPTPIPHLQWLGHFVVDRSINVKDLHPLLKRALKEYRRQDSNVSGLEDGDEIDVFEEVSAASISQLKDHRSLEAQRIPYESGSGDILVFQKKLPDEKPDVFEWDGLQTPSQGDGTDPPLGGRPLPTVSSYYDYLAYRIKIGFKDKYSVGTTDEGKSIFFELLRVDTYRTARRVLAGVLGEDADCDYLRFFSHDFNREAPGQEPLRLGDNDQLQRVVPMHNLVTAGQTEYRTLWYEQTEYHISEFDQKDEVRVVWRPDGGARATPYATSGGGTSGGGSVDTSGTNMSIADGTEEDKKAGENDKDMVTKTVGHATNGDGSRSFSVLVPMMSKYADVMDQVRQKLCINPEVDIRMFEVKNSKICKFTNPGESVPPIMTGSHDCGAELRAEPVPADETEEALGLDYELIRVLHLAKDKKSRAYRGLQFFGVPFVIKVKKDGEPVGAIRRRIQQKLGVPFEEFDEWPLAEIVQLKVVYLEKDDAVYSPCHRASLEFCSLAIEHKSTAPARRSSAMSRYADKPLKIRS